MLRHARSVIGRARGVFGPITRRMQLNEAMVRNIGKGTLRSPRGKCLVSYITPFVKLLNARRHRAKHGWDPESCKAVMDTLATKLARHTMHWESGEMVRQLVARGFIVDCLDDRKGHLLDEVEHYDVIIDEWDNLKRWQTRAPNARRLHYATGIEWLTHNRAELRRVAWFFERHGKYVPAQRLVAPLTSTEAASIITCFGNKKNQATFGYYRSKVRKLWISAARTCPCLSPKNWQRARHCFVWFGSPGWILKGLDLVVEAFLQEPKLELVICGGGLDRNVSRFWEVYGPDIQKAGNITYREWVDPLSDEFQEIMDTTCAIVYPSAAEGCSGGVVQTLHFGLIPLVTEINGLEVHDSWPPLAGESDLEIIANIRQRCRELSEMPEDELEEWRHFFWEHARVHHTRAAYSRSLEVVLDELLDR